MRSRNGATPPPIKLALMPPHPPRQFPAPRCAEGVPKQWLVTLQIYVPCRRPAGALLPHVRI